MKEYILQLVGREIVISEDIAQKLRSLLLKDEIPKFVGIEDEVIQTSSIMGIFKPIPVVNIDEKIIKIPEKTQ